MVFLFIGQASVCRFCLILQLFGGEAKGGGVGRITAMAKLPVKIDPYADRELKAVGRAWADPLLRLS